MSLALRLSRLIDRLNAWVGGAATWLVLVMTLVSAGNAAIRYLFNASSNAWLEIQWYLFAAIFLLCAGHTLMRNEHVRIDVLSGRFGRRAQAWIDLMGGVLFLLPITGLILWLSWPMFVASLVSGEMSSDAGGLLRWPAKLLIPVGFALLALQGISEIIKRIAFLAGRTDDPAAQSAHEGGHG